MKNRTVFLNLTIVSLFRRKVGNDRVLAPEVDAIANTNPQLVCFVVTSNKNSNADM